MSSRVDDVNVMITSVLNRFIRIQMYFELKNIGTHFTLLGSSLLAFIITESSYA